MRIINNVERIGKIMSKYMTVLIVGVSIYSFVQPKTFMWVVPNMNTILQIMMFSVGVTISLEQFKLVLERPKDVFVGALGQFTIMPLVAFLVAKLLNLPPEITIGLILVGSCPGGVSSNVMSFIAKGDVALSVSLTTVSTLIAPIATPILTLMLAGNYIDVSASSMFMSIIKVVLVPIIAGILCNRYLPKISEVTEKCIPMISSISLMCLVGGVTSNSIDNLKTTGVLLFVAVIIHNVFGHLLGYILAAKFGMDEEKRRVVSLEVGMQNTGLATTLAVNHFSLLVALPAAIAGTWQTIFSVVLANYWAKKIDDLNTEVVGQGNSY
ncbi:MAG: bile acid:sodium symporter family protein [Peptostreptococcaceae bacterium]